MSSNANEDDDIVSDDSDDSWRRPAPVTASSAAASSSSKTRPALSAPASSRSVSQWSDEYTPVELADVSVHPKKIEEIQKWLAPRLGVLSGDVPPHLNVCRILLLKGPPGGGKTAALRAVARSLDASVSEWINPSRESWSSFTHSFSSSNIAAEDYVAYTPLWKQFNNFLLRDEKYPSLATSATTTANDQQRPRKVILIEDMPSMSTRVQIDALHASLRAYARQGRYPLVLIVSDTRQGESELRQLVPADMLASPLVHQIPFNPASHTLLLKAMNRIVELRLSATPPLPVPSPNFMEATALACPGDIRAAINTLQFACATGSGSAQIVSSTTNGSSSSSSRKRKRSSTSATKTAKKAAMAPLRRSTALSDDTVRSLHRDGAVGGRDFSMYIFHALGKILHCKRESLETDERLPGAVASRTRRMNTYCPEDVVERSHLDPNRFTLFLHENCVEYFSDVEPLWEALDAISAADTLVGPWTTREMLSSASASVAVRGYQYAQATRPASTGQMRQIRRSLAPETDRKCRERMAQVDLFLRHPPSAYVEHHTLSLLERSSCVELCTDTIPLMQPMARQVRMLPQGLALVVSLTRFAPVGHVGGRLSERDVLVAEEGEEEEEEGGSAGMGVGVSGGAVEHSASGLSAVADLYLDDDDIEEDNE